MYKYTLQLDFTEATSHGLLVKNIPDGSKILEFGCSNGQLAEYVKTNKGCSVFGIDISETAVDAAMPHLIGGFVANIERDDWQSRLGDEKFDILLFSDVLEHLTNPVKVLRDALKFLKYDGRVLFSVPNIAHGDVILKLLAQRFDYTSHGLLDDTHVHFFSKENLSGFCEDSGLFLSILDATYCPIGASEQKFDANPIFENLIKDCDYTTVYQYVCVAYKTEFAKKHNMQPCDNVKKRNEAIYVFFDTGIGFSADDSIAFDAKELSGELDLNLPKNCKHLRIDLREGRGYVLKKCSFSCDGNLISPTFTHNVTKIGDTEYFLLEDPQHIFVIPENAEKFHARFDISGIFEENNYSKFLDDINEQAITFVDTTKELDFMKPQIEKISEKVEAISSELDTKLGHFAALTDKVVELNRELDTVKAENKTLRDSLFKAESELKVTSNEHAKLKKEANKNENELDHYKTHYFAAINQRTQLQARITELEGMYSCISRSACWRMTKPLRVMLDIIKKPLRKIKLLRLIRNGIRCYRENGLRYTLKRIIKKCKKVSEPISYKYLYDAEVLDKQCKTVFSKNIKFSIIVPLYNTPDKFLKQMIQSVLDQTYSNWELCLADGSDKKHANVKKICCKYAKDDPKKRIIYKKLEKNLGISENTNAAISLASGDYITLFDHDDLLHPSALYEVMNVICTNNADFIYTDENTFDTSPDKAYCPNFKPDYAPDTLRSYNYICHLTTFKTTLLKKTGLFRKEFDGSQDYDMILRLTECAEKIVHIPKILYYWRCHKNSVASDISAKPYTMTAAKKALAEHLRRVGLEGTVTDAANPSTYRIKYIISDSPLVSIIIPNKDHTDDLDVCIKSIIEKSTYTNYEIIVTENNSTKKETFEYYEKIEKQYSNVKVIKWEHEFNYSKINNFAFKYCSGEYLILLNNDIEILTPEWIEEMLMFNQRSDVGAVGMMLYYPDNTIQHAGVIVGLGGVAGHSHKYFPRNHVGYMYRLTLTQNLSAVTAAALMVKRSVFEEVNGLDEDFAVAFNDIDFCMKIRDCGHLIVWTPYAEAYHHESKSRGVEDTPEKQLRFAGEVNRFHKKWGEFLKHGDPYYNKNLTLDREDFSFKNDD